MSLVSLCLDWLTSLNFRAAGKFVNAGRMNKSEPTLSDANGKVISSSFNSSSFSKQSCIVSWVSVIKAVLSCIVSWVSVIKAVLSCITKPSMQFVSSYFSRNRGNLKIQTFEKYSTNSSIFQALRSLHACFLRRYNFP